MPKDKRISARLKERNTSRDYWNAAVAEIGPLGVALATPSEAELEIGQQLDVEISVDGETSEFAGLVVSTQDQTPNKIVYARFLSGTAKIDSSDRRTEERWLCPPTFLPNAVSPAPGKFNEFIRFQIRNISKTGLKLQTDLASSFLMRGMILRLAISLPLIGETSALCKIVRIEVAEIAGLEVMSIGAEIIDTDLQARDLLNQYVLQFGAVGALEGVKDYGLKEVSTNSNTSFEFIHSESDLVSFMELRNGEAARLTRPLDASFALYDRIAVAKTNGQIVCAVRVSFPDNANPGFFSANDNISQLPRKDQIIELSDLLAESNNPLLILGLLGFVTSTCLSGFRPYVLCYFHSAFDDMLESAGFIRPLDTEPSDPFFLGHPIDSVTGTGANPIRWNLTWYDASKYLEESKMTIPRGTSRVMLKIYRMFNKLSKLYFRYSRIKAK